jgi:hypothetical protein
MIFAVSVTPEGTDGWATWMVCPVVCCPDESVPDVCVPVSPCVPETVSCDVEEVVDVDVVGEVPVVAVAS